ncbi:MAG: hypothetical protein C4520_11875 [Candidatus Abyssobacteria bacterium SURF_5]|uniref:Uncharacterized protein n=1 Tax=Abyssobacteria bacterium (strain SURF_5) TaxID=2093360 RepID=A0A3A4NHH1_ABYX5|nr:MAG: hypothetical protein C4520_11875 [Candidatus Abyssubacteria bacterium SURF_5]
MPVPEPNTPIFKQALFIFLLLHAPALRQVTASETNFSFHKRRENLIIQIRDVTLIQGPQEAFSVRHPAEDIAVEVNFRPLPPTPAARRSAPGQVPPDQGQNFTELIENLTSAENNPEANDGSGAKKEQKKPARQKDAKALPAEQAPEEPGSAPSGDKPPAGPRKLGTHFDILA